MFYKKIIKPISEYAIDICRKQDIPFVNGATTNGYYITEDIAKELDPLKFRQFQITLDGDKQHHNKVKFTRGCESAFDYVLDNISGILKYIESAVVFLRINYTHDNITEGIVKEVNAHINPDLRSRIVILPRKVWQESVDKDFQVNIIKILDSFE